MMALKSCAVVIALFIISLMHSVAFSSFGGQRVPRRALLSMKAYLGAGPIFVAGKLRHRDLSFAFI